MPPFVLAFIYGGLGLLGASFGIPLVMQDEPARGAVALLLGLIALQDGYSWYRVGRVRNDRIQSLLLNFIDVAGVVCGVIAISAPQASDLEATVWFSLGYILACLAFWSTFARLDPTFHALVMETWEMRKGETVSYVVAFAVAAVVLAFFLVMIRTGAWGDADPATWTYLACALGLYWVLYAFIGPMMRLLRRV